MPLKRKAASEGEAQRKKLRVAVSATADLAGASLTSLSPPSSNAGSDYHEEPLDDELDAELETKALTTPVATSVGSSALGSVKARSSPKYPSDRKIHRCPFENCNKAFNRPARLQEHLRSHNNERIFCCPQEGCGKSFIRASHLNHHVKSAHTTIRDYVCPRPGCGKSFVTGTRLRRHMAAHEVRDKYKCTGYADCDETFRKHSTLQRHIKSVHLGQKPFPCDRDGCTAGFETAGHLRVHIARMHGEPRFTCTECENARENETPVDGSVGPAATSFPTYAQLQTHIRNAHPPVCTECGQSCASARDLRRHTELLHGAGSQAAGTETVEGDKPKDCHICPFPACARAFSKKGNLNVHIRTVHEGEKRFVCGETDLSQSRKVEGFDNALGCGKRYGSKLALEEHVRVAHLGLKNAKAERRERLSNLQQTKYESASDLTAEAMENNPDLTRLTGDDISNPEKRSSRNIPCLLSACMCRFYRDYDLWLHMTAYHAMGEAEVQMFFMQRAMTGGYESFDVGEGFQFSGADDFGVPQDNTGVPGIQGNADMSFDFLNMDLSLDTTTATFPSTEAFTAPVAATNSKDMASFLEQTPDQVAELDMTLVDPSLSYNFDN